MSSTAMAERPASQLTAQTIESVVLGGDLSKLSPEQRLAYYNRLCESLDLNPLTKPFEYIPLNGKLTLYARKDCTEQLRAKRRVSVTITGREISEDCYVVTARATQNERQDESIGAVSIAGLKGEARANAMMKAETKAKRRVTLSICGLGMLDETEVETIAAPRAVAVSADPPVTVIDTTTGAEVPATDRPAAPEGYAYIDHYALKSPWHEITFDKWDETAGKLTLSTKLKVGELACQAFQQGVPVKVLDWTPKLNRSGEGYLNKLELWKPQRVDDGADLLAEDIGF